MFKDRKDAGLQLAKELEQCRGTGAIVLALPRGGVVVGHEIAQLLGLPLDIVVTRKIGHPGNPEYAICAVDENGTLLCNESEKNLMNEKWLKDEIEKQITEAKRRTRVYRGDGVRKRIKGKTVIVTDDGVATGLTMRLAIKAIKAQNPKRIVVAVPVAPPEIARKLKSEVDELVVLSPPEEFAGAVGAHYQEFEQIDDDTVISLLRSQ